MLESSTSFFEITFVIIVAALGLFILMLFGPDMFSQSGEIVLVEDRSAEYNVIMEEVFPDIENDGIAIAIQNIKDVDSNELDEIYDYKFIHHIESNKILNNSAYIEMLDNHGSNDKNRLIISVAQAKD